MSATGQCESERHRHLGRCYDDLPNRCRSEYGEWRDALDARILNQLRQIEGSERSPTWVIMLFLAGTPPAQARETATPDSNAGGWKTWVIPSGKQYRVPPPPDRAATEEEAAELVKLTSSRDQATLETSLTE